jgi:hypothetical protein
MTSITSKNLENSVVNIVLYSIVRVRVMVMVFSATYSNISFINVVNSNPAQDERYSLQYYMINLSVTCDRSVVFL